MQTLQAILTAAGKPHRIKSQEIPAAPSLMDMGARLAGQEGTVLLMSGGRLDTAQYHILGICPWMTLKGRGRVLRLTIDGREHRLERDALMALRAILEHFKSDPRAEGDPLAAGLMGYLAYDLKDALEDLPRTAVDRWRLPHTCLYAPSAIVVQNVRSGKTVQHELIRSEAIGRSVPTNPPPDWSALIGQEPPDELFSIDAAVKSNFDQAGYEAAVAQIRDYIAAGDVYQVNLSQRFETSFAGSAFGFFRTLFDANPAPFFAFINAGDHTVVSTSPERFIKMDGRRVETRPIKGTRPRCLDTQTDQAMRDELQTSPKDDAELSMIVDLLRNDLGRACRGGSVRVVRHKALEAYENVYHLVSTVEGELDPGRDAVDLMRAVFPGGSITGCPKIRAMEIIDELEPDRRHVYTGAIGYFSFHRTLDLSIAIRTAVIHQNRMAFSVGGGVVYDSDPRAEYEETLHKGQTLINVCQTCAPFDASVDWVWFNGRLCPSEKACLPVGDEGLRYGNGFFETIRADAGRVALLPEHLSRFNHTWQALLNSEPPDITWADVIHQVLARNDLLDCTAALRIIATGGDPQGSVSGSLWVTAQPYRHRLAVLTARGLDLRIYPHPRQTPLADYKTLNYLFYKRAGEWARQKGGHEALILNPDGSLSETNTANLLIIRNRTALRPLSNHVLPGVMERFACRQLANLGFGIKRQPLYPDDLFEADQVFLTNALMGVVPVIRVDNTPLAKPTDLSRKLNTAIFGISDIINAR